MLHSPQLSFTFELTKLSNSCLPTWDKTMCRQGLVLGTFSIGLMLQGCTPKASEQPHYAECYLLGLCIAESFRGSGCFAHIPEQLSSAICCKLHVGDSVLGIQMQAAKASGSLNLQRLLDMQESGVDINSFTSSEMRLNMYSKEVRPALPPLQYVLLHKNNASMLTCTTPWLGVPKAQLPLAHQWP